MQAKIEMYVFISYFQFTIVYFSIFVNSMVEIYLVAKEISNIRRKGAAEYADYLFQHKVII